MVGRARNTSRGLGSEGQRRDALDNIYKRLFYCVNVNRTSLDHLLLGGCADID